MDVPTIASAEAQQEETVIGTLSLVIYANGRAEITRDGVFANEALISDILSRLARSTG